MGLLTEHLLKEQPYSYKQGDKEQGSSFYRALLEELCFHYDHNSLYRMFCDHKEFNPHIFDGDISEIPPVQVSVFKELGNQLNSVPKEQVKLTLQSSATSGIPSSIPIDAITSRRQAKSMVHIVGDFIGNERKPFLVMDVDPMSGFREVLGARYAAVSGYLNFASQVGYFLKINEKNRYYFDIDGIQKFIDGLDGQSAVVFGFTYIFYSEVIQPLMEQGVQFNLPENSKVIHIGGWKKLEAERVSKEQFNALVSQVFGISEENVIDIYGFTEQMGLNYPDCPCGCKHAPLYSEVIVRDVATKEVLAPGKEGLLEFVTPLPHSYPGNAVLTDDVGTLVEGKCEYHRGGKRFKILGRLKKAEVRGCGDILSSKLKFIGEKEISADGKGSEDFRIYYKDDIKMEDLDAEEILQILYEKLVDKLAWLRKQPIDALIGLIQKVAEKWKMQSDSFAEPQDQGLKFLVSWCTAENMAKIANEGLRGNRSYIDTFVPRDDTGVRYMKATSRGLVCHWLAGNVQVLGMFVLIQSILTKNVNLIKVSSRDNGIFKNLLTAFEGESYTTKGGYSISGDDLLNTIALVYFDRTDKKCGYKMSTMADVRVAWGGNEAVSAVSSYPSKYNCKDIIMGPKLSFSVVAKESISDKRKTKKLARKIAVDASVFNQTGCASTHNIFVEKGGEISPSEFAAYLAEGMEKVARQLPKGIMTPEELAMVHSVRGVYDFKGIVYGDRDLVWTVLYSQQAELNSPVYSRVVFVHEIEKLEDVLEFISDDIQTIGLAAEGGKAMAFAALAAERGAVRFPTCGKMLNFESPWDGMFIMEHLVNWNTLGEPFI